MNVGAPDGPGEPIAENSRNRSVSSHSWSKVHVTLVIGVGSPHGDDQAGWEVVKRLGGDFKEISSHSAGQQQLVYFRTAVVPPDMLDWLDGVDTAHVIDACIGGHSAVQRFQIEAADAQLRIFAVAAGGVDPKKSTAKPIGSERREISFEQLPKLRSASTHHFQVIDVLQLAAALGKLPAEIHLWTIAIEDAHPGRALGRMAAINARSCSELLLAELRPGLIQKVQPNA